MATPEKSLSAALNATTEGSGTQAIVFAHGFGADQSLWHKLPPFFVENYRVVLFDWPFSGAVKDQSLYEPAKYSSLEAYADDLITLLDELDLKATTFVGHSMSGMVGCIASTKRPDLFKRLVLVGSSPRFINTDDCEWGFTSSDIEQLLLAIETDYEKWISGFASFLMQHPNAHLFADMYLKCLRKMRSEVALSLAKTVFYVDYREMLEKVETPCTIIQTTSDHAVPHSVALFMEKKIKGKVTLEVIDTTGHFPHLTAPLKVVEVLKGALAAEI